MQAPGMWRQALNSHSRQLVANNFMVILLVFMLWRWDYTYDPVQNVLSHMQMSVTTFIRERACESVYSCLLSYGIIYVAIIPSHVGRMACGVLMWSMVSVVKMGLSASDLVDFQCFGVLEFFMIGMTYVVIDMPSAWYFLWAFALKISLCLDLIADKEVFVRWSVLLMILIHTVQILNPPVWLLVWSKQHETQYVFAKKILVIIMSVFMGIGDALYDAYARVARVNNHREILQDKEYESKPQLRLQNTSGWEGVTSRHEDSQVSGSFHDGNPSQRDRHGVSYQHENYGIHTRRNHINDPPGNARQHHVNDHSENALVSEAVNAGAGVGSHQYSRQKRQMSIGSTTDYSSRNSKIRKS